MAYLLRVLLVFLLCGFSVPAFALTGQWQEKEQASARLIISDHNMDKGPVLGLEFQLKPGWHIYWRSPGDAGLPPQLNWDASQNAAPGTMYFPVPKLESLQGLNTYGYAEHIVFPIDVKAKDAALPMHLAAKVNALICADICVPINFDLTLDVPAKFETAAEEAGLLDAAWAHVPRQDDGQGPLSLASAAVVEDAGQKAIRLAYTAKQPLTDVDVIAEVGDGSTLAIPSSSIKDGAVYAVLTLDDVAKDALGKELIFTLVDKTSGAAVEKKLLLGGEGGAAATPAATPAVTPQATETPAAPVEMLKPDMPPINFGLMILFALLGGLVLNLMPCVLPVLALKSLSFVQHGGGTASGVRLSFFFTSLGILSSFLVMALSLIALKEVGMSVGWGVQFQHPAFLIGLIAILLLFAFNLWGFFEIPLPRFLADRLSWTQGHGSLAKDFFSGAFATLLATPCSAPFLGTAIGFALASGPFEILSIFLALGFGLASPFIAIALFPKVATMLPRPGKWMNNVKRILALALFGTAVWLGYVLAVQVNATDNHDAMWQDFNQAKIAQYVAEDKIVFVDVTAEWCLTCKANKKFVLGRDDVKAALHKDNVVLMRADWTKPNETIAAYLKQYGRFGIPFNIIYSKAVPEGLPLPELLTKEAVLQGLEKAGNH